LGREGSTTPKLNFIDFSLIAFSNSE